MIGGLGSGQSEVVESRVVKFPFSMSRFICQILALICDVQIFHIPVLADFQCQDFRQDLFLNILMFRYFKMLLPVM